MKRGATAVVGGLAVVVTVTAVGIAVLKATDSIVGGPSGDCTVTVDGHTVEVSGEQAENASLIVATAVRRGMPARAASIALATAYQESKLSNIDYGDRDSLGLFQQRPSQGWGTPAEILTPSRAAQVFFEHLTRVDGWESAPVTVAAQAVQRSATPSAYAQWEPRAQVLTQALTGQVAAALRCRFPSAGSVVPTLTLDQAVTQELGAPALGASVTTARGWTISAWLVAHARSYRITSVTFAGLTWTSATGSWSGRAPLESVVRFTAS